MPKPMSIPDLFTTLAASAAAPVAMGAGAAGMAAEPKSHFLFLLGTDTKFTPAPTTSYIRGETLSYAAQATVAVLGETGVSDAASPHSYASASVDVINGPTTLGTEVGDRIARGIFLGLRAAAEGKTRLQITAHSRGAVEALIVMHELDRIKKALRATPEKSLKAIMLEAGCDYTRAAIPTLFTEASGTTETPASRASLAERLERLEVNPFLIDPVPGDTAYMLPYIGWHNDLFYKEPPCTHHELLICANERTTCFYPVIPKGITPNIILGHHGTASGNPLTQQHTAITGATDKTSGVQDLVLLKWLHFQHSITGIFSQRREPLTLAHTDLDGVTNCYLLGEATVRSKLLVDTYTHVHKNKAAYSRFNDTSYAVLGRYPAADGGRNIHFGSRELTSLSRIMPATGEHFVNIEHAKLVLADSFEEFAGIYDAEITAQITAVQATFSKMTAPDLDGDRLRTGLSNEAVREPFFEGLSILIDSISQKYLRNNLSEAQKTVLMEGIRTPFSLLATSIAGGGTHQAIFKQCQGVLQEGIKKTIEAHFGLISEQVTRLQQQTSLFLAAPAVFNERFTAFLAVLAAQVGDPKLAAIHARLSALDPVTTFSVQEALRRELTHIEADAELTRDQREAYQLLLCNEPLRAHFDANQNSLEEYLLKTQKLHETVRELSYIHQTLSPLLGAKTLDFSLAQITEQRKGLKTLAGTLLWKKEHDLRIKPETLSDEFFEMAQKKAIKLGAPSPDARNLADERASLAAARGQVATLEETVRLQEAFIQNLSSASEVNASFIINNKLLPLTQNYLEHLLSKARQYSPIIDSRFNNQDLPDIMGSESYNRIKMKYYAVLALYRQLTDPLVELPSARLTTFNDELRACEQHLRTHRDNVFKAYFKSCVAAIAILATGIIPGLLAVGVYSRVTGKSPFFFANTSGADYVEDVSLATRLRG